MGLKTSYNSRNLRNKKLPKSDKKVDKGCNNFQGSVNCKIRGWLVAPVLVLYYLSAPVSWSIKRLWVSLLFLGWVASPKEVTSTILSRYHNSKLKKPTKLETNTPGTLKCQTSSHPDTREAPLWRTWGGVWHFRPGSNALVTRPPHLSLGRGEGFILHSTSDITINSACETD